MSAQFSNSSFEGFTTSSSSEPLASSLGKMNSSQCASWDNINPNANIELTYMIARATVGIVAMIGNLLIVLSVIRFNYLKKASAYYLCNMAVADFLLGFVGATYPLRVSYFQKTNEITRTLSFAVHNFAVFHSMASMVIVAADRFSYICHPLTYEAKIFATRPYLFIILSILWTTGILSGLLFIFTNHTEVMIKYGSIFDLIYFLITVGVLFVLYGAILKVAHEQRAKDEKQLADLAPNNQNSLQATAENGKSNKGSGKEPSRKNREAKANRRVIYGYMFIVGTFIVTYVYAYVMQQTRPNLDFCSMGYEKTSMFYFSMLASITLQNFNAVCNPVVYSYCLNHFRKAFRKNIIQIFTCGRKSGDLRDNTRSIFVLDVPDDRKRASTATKKSLVDGGMGNTLLSNGSTSKPRAGKQVSHDSAC